MARTHGPSVLSIMNAVRKTRDSPLLLFFLLGVTRQLSTADRLVWPPVLRTPDRLACAKCTRPQCAEHVLKCPSVRSRVRVMRNTVGDSVQSIVQVALTSDRLSHAHKQILRDCPFRLAWFDPTRPPMADGFLGCDLPRTSAAYRPTAAANSHDRYAGSLGILPQGLSDLLCPSPGALGARECLHGMIRQDASDKLSLLRLQILRESKDIYELWYGHPVSYGLRRQPVLSRGLAPVILTPSARTGRRPVGGAGGIRPPRRLVRRPLPRTHGRARPSQTSRVSSVWDCVTGLWRRSKPPPAT